LTKISSKIASVHAISVSSSGPGVPNQRLNRRAGTRLESSATSIRPPASATSASAVSATKAASAGTSERGAARRRIETSRS
jgi:hypothetical protein